jgi:hypothetical protein
MAVLLLLLRSRLAANHRRLKLSLPHRPVTCGADARYRRGGGAMEPLNIFRLSLEVMVRYTILVYFMYSIRKSGKQPCYRISILMCLPT